jgi:hypothetical protein
MQHPNPTFRLVILTGILALGACDAAGPRAVHPVDIRVAARTTSGPGVAASTAGPLEITGLSMVVGQAALGSGDQFGCIDCQDNGSETAPAPVTIAVPVDGSPVSIAVERVAAGRYSAVEIEVVLPSIVISGRFNGVAFTLPLSIEGSLRETLSPPVDVPASGLSGPVPVTITLPVAAWFTSGGRDLDPANPADRALIESNARASFQAPESADSEGES